jgi:precorrin-3B synthase
MAECPGIHVLADMRDGLLARIRVPGGEIGTGALRRLAEAAHDFGDGALELTNRANLQLRGLRSEHLDAFRGAVAAAGLAPAVPETDRLRNVVASPLRGLVPEVLDMSPMVAELDAALQSRPDLRALSPKFGFALDGGGTWSVLGIGHDVGVRAERRASPVLRLSLGAPSRCGIAPEGGVGALLAAAALAASAPEGRMRGIVLRDGPEAVLRRIARALGTELQPLPPSLPSEADMPSYGALRQIRGDRVALLLGLPTQRIEAETAIGLADMTDRFGSGAVRLTPGQAVVLPNVERAASNRALATARGLGFMTDPASARLHIRACSGARGCERGRADTRADALSLRRTLDGALPRPLTIHVSGCAKGCAHPRPADFLLLARADGRYDLHRGSAAPEAERRAADGTALSSREAAEAIAALAR